MDVKVKTCPVCDSDFPDQHTTCPSDGALLFELQELAPGSTIRGKSRIVRTLGYGGMGVVYLADHLFPGGRAALKFISPELSRDYLFGDGVPQDKSKGTDLLRQSCKDGSQWHCDKMKELGIQP